MARRLLCAPVWPYGPRKIRTVSRYSRRQFAYIPSTPILLHHFLKVQIQNHSLESSESVKVWDYNAWKYFSDITIDKYVLPEWFYRNIIGEESVDLTGSDNAAVHKSITSQNEVIEVPKVPFQRLLEENLKMSRPIYALFIRHAFRLFGGRGPAQNAALTPFWFPNSFLFKFKSRESNTTKHYNGWSVLLSWR